MKLISRLLTTTALSGTAILATAAKPGSALADTGSGEVKELDITVQGGYDPGRIEVTEGQRLRLRFLRKDSGSCTRRVVFPSLGIEKELPTGELVIVELPALKAGEYEFKCAMNMIRGRIVVRARA